MICNDRKFLFVRIPKTASSTLRIALSEQDFSQSSGEKLMLRFGTSQNNKKEGKIGESVRSKYISFLNFTEAGGSDIHASLSQWSERHDLSNYFKFSFVRNPWDWIVSQYAFLKKVYYRRVRKEKQGKPAAKEFFIQRRGSFSEKLNLFGVDFSEFKRNPDSLTFDKYVEAYFSNDTLNKTQLSFLRSNDGQIGVDFVGRFESLQKDWELISEKTGLRRVNLGHTNTSLGRKPYKEYYKSASTKRIVSEGFAEDISQFNYEF